MTDKKADFGNVVGGSSSTADTPDGDSPEAIRSYVVQKGDSLSKISAKFYGSTKSWRLIFEANKDRIKDPDMIQPGWKLVIPEADDGQPGDKDGVA